MGYTPVRINTIKPGHQIPFDLYIYFKNTYLRYIENGKDPDGELLVKLKRQKVARFFILDKAEDEYQKYLDKILLVTMQSADIGAEDKASFMKGVGQTALEQMEAAPGSKQSYTMAKSAMSNLKSMVTENPEALKEFFKYGGEGKELLMDHALNCAALVGKFATFLGYRNKKIEHMMVAAVLHPLGILKMDVKFLESFFLPYHTLHVDIQKEIGSYPDISAELLRDKDWIDQEVIELVRLHGEKLSGLGPHKIKKLLPEQEILSMVIAYSKKIVIENLTPMEAIKDFLISEMGNYDLENMKNFKKVLKENGILDMAAIEFYKDAA